MVMMCRRLFLCWIAGLLVGVREVTAANVVVVPPLVLWVVEQGGFVSDKVHFLVDEDLSADNDNQKPRLVAKEAVAKGETILMIPRHCLFRPLDDAAQEENSACATARALVHHKRLGEESSYKDYMQHLFQPEKLHLSPYRWSPEAKDILRTILKGGELPSPLIQDTFVEECGLSEDEEDAFDFEDAFELVMARSWNEIMIPVLDMVQHRNGHWRNLEAIAAHDGEEDVTVVAYRDIEAGETLYLSFNDCSEPAGCPRELLYTYGTVGLFRDCGFVEDYPQRWIWHFQGLKNEDWHEPLVFEMDLITKPDLYSGELTTRLQGTWLSENWPDLQVTNVMTSQLLYLEQLRDYVHNSTQALQSSHERTAIQKYYETIQMALKYAMWSIYDRTIDYLEFKYTSRTSIRQYDKLKARPTIGNPTNLLFDTCHARYQGIGEGYEELYSIKTQYQLLAYSHDEEKDDTCLWIDYIAHTCTTYQVLQEPLVHYAASFLPQLKRVAFIGGGDSLILQEVLKYPTIELVVGLELDQVVVRTSFQYMGSQPHFEDPRVEWWFGDASKTLMVLPDDYFGSFDLVLVDLTNDVADVLYVTETHTLMDSMGLLVNASHGIISKQEDFPNPKIMDYARYTLDLSYCDLPQICRQSMSIGSNAVNFLTAPQYDHQVPTLYLNDTLDFTTRFRDVYGFRDNYRSVEGDATPLEKSSCSQRDEANDDAIGPLSQPGILLILEAEKLSGSVHTKDEFVTALSKALNVTGFKVESVEYHMVGAFFDIFLVFHEGYLMLRKRHTDYASIDVHLWDSFDKLNALKTKLLAEIGSNNAPSYRVMVGGMNGTKRRPYLFRQQSTQIAKNKEVCANPVVEKVEESAGQAGPGVEYDSNLALSELVRMIPSTMPPSIVVLCGSRNERCASHEALKTLEDINVIPLYTCPGIADTSSADALFKCEASIATTIREFMSSNNKINGILVDSMATYAMARVLHRSLVGTIGRAEILADWNYVVLAKLSGDEWRNFFVERFRKEVSPFVPSKEARLSFPDGSKYALFSAGDEDFYSHLVQILETIQTKTGQAVSIDSVESAHGTYSLIFEPKIFNNAAFDKSKASKQWAGQHPTGFQAIFQMELKPPKPSLDLGEEVLFQVDDTPWKGVWVPVEIAGFNEEDMTYAMILPNGDEVAGVPRRKLRRLDQAVSPSDEIPVGTRVLTRDFEESGGVWHLGFVESRSQNGLKYRVWYQDTDRTVDELTLVNVLPEAEPVQAYDLPPLTVELLGDVFRHAFAGIFGDDSSFQMQQSDHRVEDGCVLTAFGEGGNAVLVWGGSTHIDINLYLDSEDYREAVDQLQEEFEEEIPFLVTIARDDQPRGYDNVINFASEIRRAQQEETSPLWRRGGGVCDESSTGQADEDGEQQCFYP